MWAYIVDRLADYGDGGWFNYVPEGPVEPYLGGSESVLVPALAIVSIAVWAGASLWLLGGPYAGRPDRPSGPASN